MKRIRISYMYNRGIITFIMLVLMLFIGIGYSAINVTEDIEATVNIKSNVIRSTTGYYDKTAYYNYRSKIKNVYFGNEINIPDNAVYELDVSAKGDNSVIAFFMENADDSTMYDLYIQADGLITLNEDMSNFFYNLTKVEKVTGLEYLDTSKVTNMSGMFGYCSNLTSLDISNFDTSNVTNMESTFYGCEKLTSLDVTNFDTSNVTSMSYMFYNCSGLTNLDVSNFDTSNVTNISGMFVYCKKLTNLDVTNFNTSNVTSMHGMFFSCSGLTSLDVTNLIRVM